MPTVTKKHKRSLINKYFNNDIFLEMYAITLSSGIDNNDRYIMMQDILRNHSIPFTQLGAGTNRSAILLDGYALKIALDKDGIDK